MEVQLQRLLLPGSTRKGGGEVEEGWVGKGGGGEVGAEVPDTSGWVGKEGEGVGSEVVGGEEGDGIGYGGEGDPQLDQVLQDGQNHR